LTIYYIYNICNNTIYQLYCCKSRIYLVNFENYFSKYIQFVDNLLLFIYIELVFRNICNLQTIYSYLYIYRIYFSKHIQFANNLLIVCYCCIKLLCYCCIKLLYTIALNLVFVILKLRILLTI